MGISGVGKTRILNALERVRSAGLQNARKTNGCKWTLRFRVGENTYEWSAIHFSFKLADKGEGKLRNKLAALKSDSPKREKLEKDLRQCVALKAEIKAQRPSMPQHIALKDSKLAGELIYHDPHYKTVIDTIRIACANAENDLALHLADHLRRPIETKKSIANIVNSTGDIRVTEKSITIALKLIGRKDEFQAATHLFQEINERKLSLPGDPQGRPLQFKSKL